MGSFHKDAIPSRRRTTLGANRQPGNRKRFWEVGEAEIFLAEWLTERAAELIHNDLALHASVPETTGMAALERVGSGGLRQEFNCRRLPFFEQPAVLGRNKNQPRLAARVGNGGDFKTMIVVNGIDLELDPGPCLDVDGRRRILILFCTKFNDLNVLTLS